VTDIIVADKFDQVVGVDTHARNHTYCVVHSRTGAVVDTADAWLKAKPNERSAGSSSATSAAPPSAAYRSESLDSHP